MNRLQVLLSVILSAGALQSPAMADDQAATPKKSNILLSNFGIWASPTEVDPMVFVSRLSEKWLAEEHESAAKLGSSGYVSISCDILSKQILVSSFVRLESTDPSIDRAALATLAAVTTVLKPDSAYEPVYRYNIEFYKDRVNVFSIGTVPKYPDAFEARF